MTNNDVAQPAAVAGAPERIWLPLDAAQGWAKPEIREPNDIAYIRTTPADLTERARRVALKLKYDADDLFAMPVNDEPIVTQWAAIIAAEFGGGEVNQST